MQKYITKRNLANVVLLIGGLYLSLNAYGVNNFEELKTFVSVAINDWEKLVGFGLLFIGYITNDDLRSKVFEKLFGGGE